MSGSLVLWTSVRHALFRLFPWALLLLLVTACGPGPVVEVEAGKDYVCARSQRGQTACHNYDAAGGPDNWISTAQWPSEWPSLETPAVKLQTMTTRYVHFCGLDRKGTIYCTGRTEFYEPIPTGSYAEVVAGSYSTCALNVAGEATCWGKSFYSDENYYKGSDLEPPPGPFQHVYPHDNGWCGQRLDGTMSCWGYNYFGAASPPEGVAMADVFYDGNYAYCGLTVQGDTQCWGRDDRAPDFQAFLSEQYPYTQVAMGLEAACALNDSGDVHCKSLPDIDPTEYSPPPGIKFSQITAGYRFFCGLTDEPVRGHRVLCWGCRWDDDPSPDHPGQCVQPPW